MTPLWSLTQMTKNRKGLYPLHPLTMRKGHPAVYEYQPKSPSIAFPSEGSDEEDFSSIPDLATPAEEMSTTPDQPNDSGYKTQDTAPADVNADQDSFKDKDRQKALAQALEDHLSKAPWQKESAKGPLKDLEKIAKVSSPFMMDSGMKGTRT